MPPSPPYSWDHPNRGQGTGAGRSLEGWAQVGQLCLPSGRCTSFLRCPQALAASPQPCHSSCLSWPRLCAQALLGPFPSSSLPPPRCSGPTAPHQLLRARWPKCLRRLPGQQPCRQGHQGSCEQDPGAQQAGAGPCIRPKESLPAPCGMQEPGWRGSETAPPWPNKLQHCRSLPPSAFRLRSFPKMTHSSV